LIGVFCKADVPLDRPDNVLFFFCQDGCQWPFQSIRSLCSEPLLPAPLYSINRWGDAKLFLDKSSLCI
jgi:hypothetical protein